MAEKDTPKRIEASGFLMSIVRTLSSSTDYEEREREKARIEKSFSECDKKLGDLVTENYEDLGKILQAFSAIYKRVADSRGKIKKIREDLNSCKTLLHCKRDELRRLWIEGLEHKTVVAMMDQIEEIKEVPEKLDAYMNSKHYLHATDLIVNAVGKLEGSLANVGALRELRTELHAKKEQLHGILIEELHRQIYIKSTTPVALDYQKYGISKVKDDRVKGTMSPTKDPSALRGGGAWLGIAPPSPVDVATQVSEDLNVKHPEDEIVHFVSVLVESLNVLRKLPETIEAIKLRMQPELLALVTRASQLVADSASTQHGELLGQLEQPRYLLELLELLIQQMSCVVCLHQVTLTYIKKTSKRGDIIQLYDMVDVWSKVQAVMQLMLGDYLDVRNTSIARPQAPGNFDEPSSDIGSYFSKKRPVKPKKLSLFRFDASSHAISMNSYLREQRHFDPGQVLGVGQAVVDIGKPQYVCKPCASNITAIYTPLQNYIKEVESAIVCTPGSSSLQTFVTDFVKTVFLGQVHFQVSTSINAATKGFDALRNVIDHKTRRELGVTRPLLQSTVTVHKNTEDLCDLMHDLPDYADQFLNMICHILQDYKVTCLSAYRNIVQYDADDKRIISAMWAKDDDISRFLMSLPGWLSLQPNKGQELNQKICSEEEMRALNSKESVILINNLADTTIGTPEIIVDLNQLKTVANLHESLEWFAIKLRVFAKQLSSPLQTSRSSQDADSRFANLPPVSQKTIDTLSNLYGDFQKLAEVCLLLLHLEVRVHCFYFLLPAAKQSIYTGAIDDLDPDSNVLKLNRDLANIEEVLQQSLQPSKFKYIFDNLGYLVSSILINSSQFIKKINENGIKKMCRNIFALQQNITNITQLRESDLDHARHFYQLIYSKPDAIIQGVAEKGPQFTVAEYTSLLQLIHRSSVGSDVALLNARIQRLVEVMERGQDVGVV